MRLELTIPDPLYDGAQRAAAARGLSLEAYFADAVQLHLQEDQEDEMGWFFTPERVAEIEAASVEAHNGDSLGLDDFKAGREKWRAEWQATHPSSK